MTTETLLIAGTIILIPCMVVIQSVVLSIAREDNMALAKTVSATTDNLKSYTDNAKVAIDINLEVLAEPGKIPKGLIIENIESLDELRENLITKHDIILTAMPSPPPSVDGLIGLLGVCFIALLSIQVYSLYKSL
jgi:hypothetical protein